MLNCVRVFFHNGIMYKQSKDERVKTNLILYYNSKIHVMLELTNSYL